MSRVEAFLGKRLGLVALLILTLVLAMPGFSSLPPVDRDEARFSQASAQMLQSGDYIDIRQGDEARYKKPVGIYWLQAASAAITGHPEAIWSYRLVSLAGALLAVGFTFGIGRLVMPARGAFLAGALLAASLLLGGEARLAKTDAMLLATIMAGQYVIARAILPARGALVLSRAEIAGFWLALAAGILIKGPIGPMVIGTTLLGLCVVRRDLEIVRALRPVRGVAFTLLLVLPWFIAITIKSEGAFWAASVGKDLLGKVAVGQESHGAPPGTYLALLWVTFWPGAMFLAAALPTLWRDRRDRFVVFALVWIVPTWVIFEMTATKLVHYVLPTYPALALITAWALCKAPVRRGFWGALVLGAIPVIVLAAFAVAARDLGGSLGVPFWIGAAGLLLTVPAALVALRRGALAVMGVAALGCGLSLSVALFPSMARMPVLWPAKAITTLWAEHPGCALSVVGYGEPSLLFLSRRAAFFDTAATAAARLGQGECVMVVVEKAALADFRALSDAPEVGPQIAAFNIGSGRNLRLHVFLQDAADATR
ncbi:MAG: glycosyltransferase family 39 protein [Rhodobacteraceae bacterium]|nr:glycosyltransferase family 39 protein [Paracoccaceae bacterium]